MTAPDSLPLHALAEGNLAAATHDLLRALVKTFAEVDPREWTRGFTRRVSAYVT